MAERVNKLGEMLNCPFSLLEKQHELMMAYLIVLNQRLLIENIKTEK